LSPAAAPAPKSLLQRLPWKALAKWWLVGMAFLGIGTGLLWAAKDGLGMPVWLATAVSAEVTLLIRFLINDAWVFENRRPSWARLWQFHAAQAGGFLIWYAITNGLSALHMHYLIASVVGSACSMLFSVATNFLWVWRKKPG
jgi:putative flippase GtrA